MESGPRKPKGERIEGKRIITPVSTLSYLVWVTGTSSYWGTSESMRTTGFKVVLLRDC